MRCALLGLAIMALASGCGDDTKPLSVFVYTRENLWMHPSQPYAQDALRASAKARGWEIEISNEETAITTELLDRTDVVVFSLTSGVVVGAAQRAILESYFRDEHVGFVGTHSATATDWDWAFYREMVPLTFATHPADPSVVEGKLDILAVDDPLMEGVPNPWIISEEFYTFHERPEDLGLHLLYAIDEEGSTAYPDHVKVGFHPLAFTSERTGNRAFYTSLGHTNEIYANEIYMGTLERAIEWAGQERLDARNRE